MLSIPYWRVGGCGGWGGQEKVEKGGFSRKGCGSQGVSGSEDQGSRGQGGVFRALSVPHNRKGLVGPPPAWAAGPEGCMPPLIRG